MRLQCEHIFTVPPGSEQSEWASPWTEQASEASISKLVLRSKWAVRANECNEPVKKTRLSRTRNALLLVDWTDKCITIVYRLVHQEGSKPATMCHWLFCLFLPAYFAFIFPPCLLLEMTLAFPWPWVCLFAAWKCDVTWREATCSRAGQFRAKCTRV